MEDVFIGSGLVSKTLLSYCIEAVTISRDYEAIIQDIFPRTESVAAVGGEELDPHSFRQVH